MSIDRSAIAQSLAKAIAFKQCGKQAEAEAWARRLIEQMECADILAPEATAAPDPLDDFNYVGSRHHY